MFALLVFPAPLLGADVEGESPARPAGPHRATALCRLQERVPEGPDRRGRAAADAGLLVDVLDVVPGGLGRDAEVLADLLIGLPRHEREQDLELALRQTRWQLPRADRHAMPSSGVQGLGAYGDEVLPTGV